MNWKILFYTLFFCHLSLQINAQRFNGGAAAGINLSMLTGDDITAHFGLNAGFLVNARIGKKMRIGLEMLYSQNGEYILPYNYPDIGFGKVSAEFIELPLYVQYPLLKKDGYHRVKLQGGIAYTGLFDLYLEDKNGIDITNQVELRQELIDIHFQAGLTWAFHPHWGINMRITRPIEAALDPTISGRLVWNFLKE